MTSELVTRIVYDERFERLVPADARLDRLAGGAIWAEGPVYLPDEDAVVWSDVRSDRVLRWSDADGVSELYAPGDFANGHTLDLDGRSWPASTARGASPATRRTARARRSWIASRVTGSTRRTT